ncbi:MAG: hypothetical protein FWG37_04365 [Clostridia bacterium]|nr:hypothetical protein [Clostridia bacterium]
MLDAIRNAKRPVALTGAGISAPSGVPTFQTLWKGRPVREFLSREYFRRDLAGFLELFCYMERWCDAEPNAAHTALAREGVRVITQNIDGLHQKAGSSGVIELHGNLRWVCCAECGLKIPAKQICGEILPLIDSGDMEGACSLFRCACGGPLDSDVVLYGDAVRGIAEAADIVAGCDLLLVIGTALEVYPAAALPDIARGNRAGILIENTDCVAALTERKGTEHEPI